MRVGGAVRAAKGSVIVLDQARASDSSLRVFCRAVCEACDMALRATWARAVAGRVRVRVLSATLCPALAALTLVSRVAVSSLAAIRPVLRAAASSRSDPVVARTCRPRRAWDSMVAAA
jgi:hypothetical protein